MADWHLRFRMREDAINAILIAVETQRPSLFNYATPNLARRNAACKPVPQPTNSASKFTILDPLVLGQDKNQRLLTEYCFQLQSLRMDFSPLADNGPEHFRLTADLFAGIGAPDTIQQVDMLLPNVAPGPPVDNFIDYSVLACYQTSFEASGVVRWIRHQGKHALLLQATTFTFGAVGGIYAMAEHFVKTTINAVILPKALVFVNEFEIEAPDRLPPKIVIGLNPSPGINPSFTDNTLEVRLHSN